MSYPMVEVASFLDQVDISVSTQTQITASPGLTAWLAAQQISLAFTTYQTNRLFFIGHKLNGELSVNEGLFDKPMGLYAAESGFHMSTRYQIWRFDHFLTSEEESGDGTGETLMPADRVYIPRTAYTTGDLNVHDVVLDNSDNIFFVNTDFSCLATLSKDYSFVPIWQPPFITKLAAEDRCHLNGLAMVEGKPAYMTACSATDHLAGWRNHRANGGVVINVQTNEIVATGLSMPHSPRWYQGKLWLLNSGTGELGYLDAGEFVPITFCPGFVRGLAFWENFALVGLSKLRSHSFTGLALEQRLHDQGKSSQCGLMVIDLNNGEIVHWVHFEGGVEELFDVVVLPGARQPQTLDFQSEEIQRLVTFPNSGGIVVTKPTVKRPSLGMAASIAGMPTSPPTPLLQGEGSKTSPSTPLLQGEESILTPPFPRREGGQGGLGSPATTFKFQRVYHLNADNLSNYEPFTFPSLQQRWQTQPQRGELIGTSASVSGEMVGFAIAEILPNQTAELISLFVAPSYRQQGVGIRLLQYLEQELTAQGCSQVEVLYQATTLTAQALEPILQKLHWQTPMPQQLLPSLVGKSQWWRVLKSLSSSQSLVETDQTAQSLFEQGRQLANQGNLAAAVSYFSQAIQLQPDFIPAYNQLGNTLQRLGNLEAAIASYQQLLTINPNFAPAHCNLGAIWQLQGQTEKAIAAYQQALQLQPNLAAAHLNLAKLLAALGRQDEAAIHE